MTEINVDPGDEQEHVDQKFKKGWNKELWLDYVYGKDRNKPQGDLHQKIKLVIDGVVLDEQQKRALAKMQNDLFVFGECRLYIPMPGRTTELL